MDGAQDAKTGIAVAFRRTPLLQFGPNQHTFRRDSFGLQPQESRDQGNDLELQ